jgi:hypothetical protein
MHRAERARWFPAWVAIWAILLMALPVVAAAPPPAAGPPQGTAPLAHPASAVHVLTSLGRSSAKAVASGSRVGSADRASGPRFHPTESPSPTGARPSAVKAPAPSYDWSSAFVFYNQPPPPTDLQLGEGASIVTDNARNETVIFGGLGSGGLSNLTWIYGYNYNASDPENSTEWGGFTNSTTFPSSRTNASFGAYQPGGVALLFGGLTSLAAQSTANDSWLYDFTNDTWTNITGPGGPPPRQEAAFAVDQKDGLALMFGGIAPEYTSRGSTGTVVWQDTWEFNFSSERWSEIATPTGPSARFGASMVWDPVSDEFLMVGGCSFSCTMDAWAFSPSSQSWSAISETGTVPPARAGASFGWDPGAHQAILYGGFSSDSNGGTVIYSDAYEFRPTGQWIPFSPEAPGPAPLYQPGPIFDASSTWADFPGCDAMWVIGGNPSLQGPPMIVYVIQPSNDSPAWQCWTFLSEPGLPPGPPPPCSRQSELVVTVQSTIRNAPIPNAIVEISGKCLPAIGRTGLDGSVDFTTNTPDNISINVSATNFHGDHLYYNFTYTNTTANTSHELIRYVNVSLTPYPALNVLVVGNDGGTFLQPVAGASVMLDNFTVVAVTGPTGWGNDSAVAQFNQSAIVSATATNYSTSWKPVFIPYAGEVNVTLVIQIAARLTVSVVDARSGAPIPGATGLVTRLDPGLPAPIHYVTNALGQFARQVPLGNYSASASATGYIANLTGGRAYVPWVTPVTIVIRLTPAYGTNESVRLVDADTGLAISVGTVTFGDDPALKTNAAGWANGTDLLPPGRTLVLGQAPGYFPNSTTVVLGYNTVLPPVTFRLKPSCLSGCPTGPGGSGGTGSPFFPIGGPALVALLAAPAFLMIVGTLYAIVIGARRGARTLRETQGAPRAGAVGRGDGGRPEV